MVIRELSREKCLQLLARTQLARLACAFENKPYVVPVYLVCHQDPFGEPCLYGFTMQGQKVEWMRANPSVCVEVDEVAGTNHWVSVLVFGRYEELPAATAEFPELGHEQLFAHQLLQAHAMWWEPATTARAASAHHDAADPVIPIFYKVRIDQVTGHEASTQGA